MFTTHMRISYAPVVRMLVLFALLSLVASAPSAQQRNEGIRKLAIHATGVSTATVAVCFTPLREGDAARPLPEVRPLEAWPGTKPV